MIDVREIYENGDYPTTNFSPVVVSKREKEVLNLFYDVLREVGVYEKYNENTMPAITGSVYVKDGSLSTLFAIVRPSKVYFTLPIQNGKLSREELVGKLGELWEVRHHDGTGYLNMELEKLNYILNKTPNNNE